MQAHAAHNLYQFAKQAQFYPSFRIITAALQGICSNATGKANYIFPQIIDLNLIRL